MIHITLGWRAGPGEAVCGACVGGGQITLSSLAGEGMVSKEGRADDEGSTVDAEDSGKVCESTEVISVDVVYEGLVSRSR